MDWRHGGFGVYIHWPFCQAKCPYCDFNSHVRRNVDQASWKAALCSDIEETARLTGPRQVDTIFFGGGTPSLMQPDVVSALIEKITAVWALAPGAEITLEANPTSVEASRFAEFREAGINRVSMGIQALRDEDLKRLGRMHTAREALAAFDVARSKFDRVSFDLIYARQQQDRKAWRSELSEALSLGVDHLSLYQLTIEANTRFGELHARGALRGMPEDALASDMYFDTQEIMEAAGMPAYEISNHARPGAESRHNRIYWRYGDYAGIGPGAHGRLTRSDGQRYATHTELNPEKWLDSTLSKTGRSTLMDVLTPRDQALECIMMGLRLAEGVDLDRIAALDAELISQSKLEFLLNEGLMEQTGSSFAISSKGRPLTNAILRELLT